MFSTAHLDAKLLNNIRFGGIDTSFHFSGGLVEIWYARIRRFMGLFFLLLSQQFLQFGFNISEVGLILEFRPSFLELYECFDYLDACECFLISASLGDEKFDNVLLRKVPFVSLRNLVKLG